MRENVHVDRAAGAGAAAPTSTPRALGGAAAARQPSGRGLRLVALLLLALIVPVGLGAGCGSTGTSRQQAVHGDLAGLRTDLSRFVKDLDQTLWALDVVVDPGSRGLRRVYDTYLARLARLEAQQAQVAASADAFRRSSSTYVAAWASENSQMRNAEIRRRSAERRRAVETEIGRVRTHLETVHARYVETHDDLRDIVVALDNDLTPDGVAALSGVVAESRDGAARTKTEIEGVIRELDGLAEALSTGPSPSPASR